MKTEQSYGQLTDNELLRCVTDNDELAFNELFARYRNRLLAYLLKVTRSQEIAEEMVLDIFIKIWNGRTGMPGIEHPEAFLFTVARNKAFDFLRQVKKSRRQQAALWERLQENQADPADKELMRGSLEATIRKAASQLSPQRKIAFLLSRDHDLTYEQIAEKLQLSTNTVRNHIAAALQIIRSHIPPGLDIIILLISLIP
ncbi:RNA polymerase sigma factor [Chitinophaga cymbidii]|uniref:DNA-directed RNA polymerase sigma-70 factor n=1 Tax=Chitinophaga cymbidii TaxID=1096750 RepID=A0A512RRH7_9BACT|nr:RNA polymerase sigma-70 factor [Chitinophaga cymbidii]GEP98290.1 DNA-directed RNA polymerase sigma-70 factor [Chitinophaga cymbidii]